MDENALVAVYCTRNSSEARFLKDLLEISGVPAVVVDDLILAAGSQLPFARVCVHQRDRAAADAIVQEWKHPPRAGSSSWTCAVCGEEIESTFDVCWNCAAVRP
jgi:Putative prokaryotic signal transducing protein